MEISSHPRNSRIARREGAAGRFPAAGDLRYRRLGENRAKAAGREAAGRQRARKRTAKRISCLTARSSPAMKRSKTFPRGRSTISRKYALNQFTAKPEKVCPIQLSLKVAAPWGRGDLSAAASGYGISGFAIGELRRTHGAKFAWQGGCFLRLWRTRAGCVPQRAARDGSGSARRMSRCR